CFLCFCILGGLRVALRAVCTGVPPRPSVASAMAFAFSLRFFLISRAPFLEILTFSVRVPPAGIVKLALPSRIVFRFFFLPFLSLILAVRVRVPAQVSFVKTAAGQESLIFARRMRSNLAFLVR